MNTSKCHESGIICRHRGVVLGGAADGDSGAGGSLRRDPVPHVDGGRPQRRRRGDHQGTYTYDVCTEGGLPK